MAESRHEQLIVALKTALESIPADGGETYWYHPNFVLRVPAFSKLCLDSSLDTIYVLSPEDVDDTRRDSCSARALLRVDLTALHKYTPETENPFEQARNGTELRWTVQSRLERDVKKLLRTDETLALWSGGVVTALEIRVPLTSYAPEETYFEGWACVFMRLEINYHYPKATP